MGKKPSRARQHINVSDAYIAYMHRRSELSSFVEFYHRLARKAIQPTIKKLNKSLYKEYHGHSAFFVENYICRIVDIFELYLDDLVHCVCQVNRGFLPAKEYIKAKARLRALGYPNADDDDAIFEASVRFGMRDKVEIAEHFRKQIGFDIAKDVPLWKSALLASKIRNQIVHKGSIVDEGFLGFFNNKSVRFEIGPSGYMMFSEKTIFKMAREVDGCINNLDKSIGDHVNVLRRNRLGHLWLPRSNWSNPLNEKEQKIKNRKKKTTV
jgi:hypothetical protein